MVASILARSAGVMPCWSKLPAGRPVGTPFSDSWKWILRSPEHIAAQPVRPSPRQYVITAAEE